MSLFAIVLPVVILIPVVGLIAVIISVRKKKKTRDKMVMELFQDKEDEREQL